jgi:hypothetical protein
VDVTRSAWIVLAAVLAGCGGIKEAEQRDRNIGDQTADITSDTRVLGDASAAVNAVIRAQDDCEQARPLIPAANDAVEKAAGQVRTPTGRTTLDGLRSQLRTISQNCP